ncbi:hypothetical protein [Desulfogranum japonicum]|uniref:hypothetical protein n=1 Tax=Desulfogranum japonicum TaxID=231447 RepID=UPI0003F4F3DA|nr:hypothetical protein [Desulfogranum japonicum]
MGNDNILLKYLIFFIGVFVLISSCSDEAYCNELSGNSKLDKYIIAYEEFGKLDYSDLPTYRDDAFQDLFNKDYVASIYNSSQSNQEKRKLLTEASIMYSDFSGIYLMKNSRLYRNETARISVLSTFSMILAYELMGDELKKLNTSFSDDKVMLFVKGLGKDFWAMNYKANDAKILDVDTTNYINNEMAELQLRVYGIEFLNYKKNINKIEKLF